MTLAEAGSALDRRSTNSDASDGLAGRVTDSKLVEELKGMHCVLLELGYVTDEGVVLVKGRSACAIEGTHEVLAVEVLVRGALDGLTVAESAALLSCLLADRSSGRPSSSATPSGSMALAAEARGLTAPLDSAIRSVLRTAEELALLCDSCGVPLVAPRQPAVDAATAAYQGVKGWTKGVDIFSKDYLMIPVHSGLHWSLIIVCYANEGEGREPMILHLDSMSPAGGHNSETVTRAIRKYLNKEWQARSNSGDGVKFTAKVMPAYRVNVPRQQNGCDCGVFILAFVERFLSDCPKVLTKEIVQRATQKHRGLSYEPKEKFLRKHWFPNEVVDELRMKMTLLVIDCVRLQLGADDASGIILTRAYDMTLKELEWRQAQTKQAEYKASREIKRRIHEAEEAKRRKLEPTVVDGDVGDGDGDDDDDDDGEDDFKISITRKPPAQPEPPSRSTTRFAGSNWSKSRTKEPVRETRQTKILPTQAFSGKSYKLGRSSPTTARAPTVNNGAWQTGNRTLQQRYLRGKEREDSERKETQEKLADTIAETKRSAGLLERLAANRNQRRD